MPVSRDLAVDLARNVADLFADAENRLAAALARQLRQDLKAEHADRLAGLSKVRQAAQAILARLETRSHDAAQRAVLEGFAAGAMSAVDDLTRLGSDRRIDWWARRSRIVDGITRLLGIARRRDMRLQEELAELRGALPGIDAMMALIQELTQRLSSTHLRVMRWEQDAYRQVMAAPALDVLAGTKTRLRASQVVMDDLFARGVTGFTDKAGRNWTLGAYAEMATRTTVAHAAVEGHIAQLRAAGTELVTVSNAPQECELCRPWEGEVLAIVGGAGPRQVEHGIEDRMVTVDVAATLGEAINAGLFHPNCRHSLGIYIPGVTRLPEHTADPQGDADRQEHRRLEREKRKAKRREAAALTPEARRKWHDKVRWRDAQLRDHVKKTGLHRQPNREQLEHDDVDPPGPRVPLPPRERRPPPAPVFDPRRKVQPPIEGGDLAEREGRDVKRRTEPARPLVGDVLPDTNDEAVERRGAIKDDLQGMFAGRTFGGLTAEVAGALGAKGYLQYEGVIRDGAKVVGRFQRTLRRDRDGVLLAQHDLLQIDPSHQGQGFASEFNELLYSWYRDSGVGYVKVHADIDVGGYTWARQGFDFEDESDAGTVLDRLRDALDNEDDPAAIAAAEDVLRRADTEAFGSENYPTAYEISQLGRSPGDTTWLGKRAMLGSDWYGVREP